MPAHAGDFIVLFRSTGGCDLFRVDEAGKRVQVGATLASPQAARGIARQSLPAGGKLWICDETAPNVIDPY